jgi:hypothetical protein
MLAVSRSRSASAAGGLRLAVVLALASLTSSAQNQAWVQQLGTSTSDWLRAAAPDGSGGVYAGGYTWGSLGSPSAGQEDAWLARFDSSGNQAWIHQFGTSAGDYLGSAASDGAGGVYVDGTTLGSLAAPNAGLFDVWVARFDGTGNSIWIRQFGTGSDDFTAVVAPDGSGGFYMGGTTYGSLGGPNAGATDAWLARFDGLGNPFWLRQLGTSAFDHVTTGAEDGSGGFYLGGSTYGVLGASSAGKIDAWLARYDSAGNQLWIRQLGTSEDDSTFASAPDGSGGVYVSGNTYGSLGGSNAGQNDVWLARYDAAGNQLWVRQLGSKSSETPGGICPDGWDGAYVSGDTHGNLGGPNAGPGFSDAWLARYDGAGKRLWIHQFGTSAGDDVYATASGGAGGLYMGGRTQGSLGGMNAGNYDVWLAGYDLCGVSTRYCIAKTNSAGCAPAITANGLASASAGSGLIISTSNVLDNKSGTFFYSKSGPSNAPFQGGTLCAQPPLVRTMLQHSGGTPPCGGWFQLDFNAYIASGKDPGLVAGQQVWIQTWSRDPGFAPPNNTSLSDALGFTICP